MGRDVFPREADREIIDAFLHGKQTAQTTLDSSVESRGGQLYYGLRDRLACAWFDTGGSLVVTILPGIDYNPSMRVIGYICERLSMPEAVIMRQVEDETDHDGNLQRTFRYFMDGKEVQPGSPIVLCGPMTIQAFRAGGK